MQDGHSAGGGDGQPETAEDHVTGTGGKTLQGLRILVVEDEFLIAHQIEETLSDAGCEVVGPAPRLERAMRIAEDEPLDGAILDINLRGDKVYPVASRLRERGIPFIFATGYTDDYLPECFRKAPLVSKPLNPAMLLKQVRASFAST